MREQSVQILIGSKFHNPFPLIATLRLTQSSGIYKMHMIIQDEMQYNHCWGCGPNNELGLQIKSVWNGKEAVSIFRPQSHHMAGPKNILNGGIIATILDCHCINTAIAHEYQLLGRPIGSLPIIWYATASIKMDYLRPTSIDSSVELRAIVESTRESVKIISGTIYSNGQATVRADVTAIRVPNDWAQFS
jgi:acyl-coenzyme A thioesterase PaaI-like protein